jgi:hypothetical protein
MEMIIFILAHPLMAIRPSGSRINGLDTTAQSPTACVFQDQLYVFWTADDLSATFTLAHQLTAKVG